jgi:protein-S-isoprenylcysteine O-methyltransferase Ste14
LSKTNHRIPSVGLLAVTLISVFLFFGLASLGWGSPAGLLRHPARSGALLIVGVASIASLFTGINLAGCYRADARDQWRLIPLVVLSLLIAVVPPIDDRLDLATIDGDATRWAGMVLMLAGSILRVGPMFVLGRRFTWPLAGQESHPLVTTGFYRHVRHPSYLGAFLGGVGWVLVFRSGIGLILVALLWPAFLPVVRSEEALLDLEYGEAYRAYRLRTWRLIPLLY